MWVLRGNATERGDDGGGPKQSSLFFLTVSHPEIGLSGARVSENLKNPRRDLGWLPRYFEEQSNKDRERYLEGPQHQ